MGAPKEIPTKMTSEFQGINLLRAKLTGVRRKLLICTAGTGVALVLISVVSLFAIGMAVDWLGELPRLGRALLLLINLGLIWLIVWRQIVEPVENAPGEDGCALLVEQALPDFRTRLIASVQLTRPGALHSNDSEAMVQVLVKQTEALATPVNFRSVVSIRHFLGCSLMAVLVIFAAVLALRFGAPASGALLCRAILLNVPVPHKTHTSVSPGNLKVGQGETIVIEARASGIIPTHGRLLIRYASGQQQEFTILPAADDHTRLPQTLDNVQESFTYRVRLNDETSEAFTIQVLERPVVTSLECQQVFPAYTKLATVRRAPTDLTLLAGSRLQLTIRANKPIAMAALRLAGLNTNAPVRISPLDKTRLIGEINIPQSGLSGFTVQLRDEDGLSAKELALYRIDILPDKPPTVAILFPERKEELVTARVTVMIGLEAHDDFGVAKLTLHYRSPAIHNGQEQTSELDLAGETPRTLRRRHEWKLTTITDSLPAETAIEYWLEAQDTNDVTGLGLATTEHYWLKVVSEDDKRADLMNQLDGFLGTLGSVAEEEERLNQNLGTLIFGKAK